MSWNATLNGKARDVAHEISGNENIPSEIKALVQKCVGHRHNVPDLNGMSVNTSGHIDASGGHVELKIQWLPLAKTAPADGDAVPEEKPDVPKVATEAPAA